MTPGPVVVAAVDTPAVPSPGAVSAVPSVPGSAVAARPTGSGPTSP